MNKQTKEIEHYQLLNRERSLINEELAQHKADEQQINQKLMWFSYLDKLIEWKIIQIENIENWTPEYKLRIGFPIRSVSRTTGVSCLSAKDVKTTVRPDLKRCRKRLVKKGRMDISYLKEVQEEHICSMKSSEITYSGTQELSDMIESMVQMIQHGNKKRAEEMKMYQELSNFMVTKESYIAPEPHPHWNTRARSKRDTDYDLYKLPHKLSILLDDLERLKRDQIERQPRVKRLKAELQYVRKKINCLNKKLKNIDSKILKVYSDNVLGDQKK